MKKPLEAEGWTSSPMWLAQPSRSVQSSLAFMWYPDIPRTDVNPAFVRLQPDSASVISTDHLSLWSYVRFPLALANARRRGCLLAAAVIAISILSSLGFGA